MGGNLLLSQALTELDFDIYIISLPLIGFLHYLFKPVLLTEWQNETLKHCEDVRVRLSEVSHD